MIGIWDRAGTLAAAIAGLPLSARASSKPNDAVAVVDAVDWTSEAARAVDAGALAILVVEPGPATPAALAELQRTVADRPVIVLRRRLAPELLPAASGAVAAVVAECAAPAPMLDAVLRDTMGWARLLAGGSLELGAGGASAGGRLAALSTGQGVSVSVVARTLSGVPDGGVIRVAALGSARREVVVDEPAGILRFTVADEHGSAELPGRLESAERSALRRAIAAIEAGDRPDDLAELIQDLSIAGGILAERG